MTSRQHKAVLELVAAIHDIPSIHSVSDYRTFDSVLSTWIPIHEQVLREIKACQKNQEFSTQTE